MEDTEFKQEKEKLQETIQKFKEVIGYYTQRTKVVEKLYKGNDVMIENFILMYDEKMHKIHKTLNNPYFARIDFRAENQNNIEKLYIGKIGVVDEENNIITVDWRSPISSIYYDSNLGNVSYNAPEGICKGELLLKRQYNIENQKLLSFQDVDTVANDDLLKPYLQSSADNRLKNIVSTIQKEQNDIIRKPINENIIVQGVAGSGKTTVALHRIAYLVYNNREQIKPNQYLVIGPNKFFINYISSVLPDLDVENVNQLTLDELTSDYLNEEFKIISEEEKFVKYIENPTSLSFEKYKVTMKFKKALDKFIEEIDNSIIPQKDIEIKGYTIFTYQHIRNIYSNLNKSINIYNTIEKKINITELLLLKEIENNFEEISTNIKEQYKNKIKNLDDNLKLKELENYESVEKELKKGLKSKIHKYLINLIPKTYKVYMQFITSINKYSEESINQEYLELTEKNLKNKKIEFEDLSALIYIKNKINGSKQFEEIKHVAIDEAQDFGEFTFYALKQLFPNSTFSIFGDLAQSIYEYRGIPNWNIVTDETFNNKCNIQNLQKSYRTTTEIMNNANNITKFLNLQIAKPVIRHGENVEYIKYNTDKEHIDLIEKTLNEYIGKGFKSIAIITKDKNEALKLYDTMDKKYQAINITDNQTSYSGKICIVPSYLSKGLEFDGVIISNASEEKYNSEKTIEMKLLYVAMTRPLHKLKILYKEKLSKPLLNCL